MSSGTKILSERTMPGANWFIGSELNYAEYVFRNMSSERPALMFQPEFQPLTEISWDELYQKVSSLTVFLRNMGVHKGDRVVSYMPNISQTIIAFLACASPISYCESRLDSVIDLVY
jgi:acetoacetyl-CoA synthetase